MANKETPTSGATATAEPEQAAPPANPENTAAMEKATGLGSVAALPAKSQVPVRLGVAPTTLEEGWRLAQLMARSSLVPKNFLNKPEDVLVAIQMGIEIGFAPMQSLQSIAVINGRPSVWGDGFLALIMASPLYADHDEYYEVDGQRRDGLVPEDFKKDTTCSVCTFIRKGKEKPVTRRFTIAQAKKAELLGKAGPWQTYPDRMLAMRARSWAGRDAFPDLLRGIKTAEEALDAPPEPDVTIDAAPIQRISETTSATTPSPASPPVNGKADVVPGAEVVLGPLGVKDVQQFLGGFTVVLSDGQEVGTTDAAEAIDLEKFKGTKSLIKLVCERSTDGHLQLKSFGLND